MRPAGRGRRWRETCEEGDRERSRETCRGDRDRSPRGERERDLERERGEREGPGDRPSGPSD